MDFQTFDFLGNCGSASLPATSALAEEAGHLQKGHKTALLGIGSGINCSLCAMNGDFKSLDNISVLTHFYYLCNLLDESIEI